jgi:hypothetical protein
VSGATNTGATVQRQNNFRPEANFPNEPFHAGNNGGKSVWYKWTAPATGNTNFRTKFPDDSTQDTVLGIYAETRPTASTVRFTPVASNDDIDSGTRRSRASFRAIQNTVYFIAVDSYGGRSGPFNLSWTQIVESQQPPAIARRLTRLTNLNNQSLIAVRLGISENVTVNIHGENFTSDSRILVNRDSCLRDASDVCTPASGLQTTFRSSTLLEASIPPPFFTRAGELRINVTTGNEIANNTGVIKVAQVNAGTAAPGQTATIESNTPFDLRPPMQYRLQATNTGPEPLQFIVRTDPMEEARFGAALALYFGSGGTTPYPAFPIPSVAYTGVAVSAAPNTGLPPLSSLMLSFAPNAASLIGQDAAGLLASATIIANDAAGVIGQDSAGIVSGGAGNIISSDGASLIGQDGAGRFETGTGVRLLENRSAGRTADNEEEIARRGSYVFRDSGGGNGDIEVEVRPDGNPALTANVELKQNTFPRIVDLKTEVVFSVALNPALLQFAQPAYTTAEGQPQLTVSVTRTGDISTAAIVDYLTTSSAQPAFGAAAGTATPGADYTSISGSLYFAPGETVKTLQIAVNDDSFGDTGDTFNIILNNAVGAAVAGTGSVRVTITDNDPVGGSVSGVVVYGTTPVGQSTKFVPGVLLAATGSNALNAVSNAFGAYSLSGFGSGTYTVAPSKSDGVNGISGLDAARVAQHVAGLITLTPNQQIAGDATNNGSLSGLDAARIAQTAAGITNSGIVGQWKFAPALRTYPSVTGPLAGENFEAILVGDVTGNWTPAAARGAGDDGLKSDVVASTHAPADPRRRNLGDSDGGAGIVEVGLRGSTVFTAPLRELTVPISVSDTSEKGIVAYDFTIKFDPRVMRPVLNATDSTGTLSAGWSVVHNSKTPGQIRVTAFGTAALVGKGVLLNLRFEMLGRTKNRAAALKWAVFEFNEGEVPSNYTGMPSFD